MKDQERQALKQFKGEHKDFVIKMKLEEDSSVHIEVLDTTIFQQFSKIIAMNNLQSEKDFANIIEEPIQLYDYIAHNFKEARLEEHCLKFSIMLGIAKKREKIIEIRLEKDDVDSLQLAYLHTVQLKEQFIVTLSQKQSRIEYLSDKVTKAQKGNELSLKLIAEEREKQQEKTRRLIKRINILQKQLEEQKMRNRDIVRASNEKMYEVQKKLFAEKEKNKQFSQNMVSPLSIQYLKMLIGHNPKNKESKYFELTQIDNRTVLLIHRGRNGWYNFINEFSIPSNTIMKYTVKIKKITGNALLLGFCTDKDLTQKHGYNNQKSVYYSCTGALYEGEARKQGYPETTAGQSVDCISDTTNGKFVWWKNGVAVAECNLPVQMKNQAIYVSALLYRNGDEIEISA